MQKRHLYQRNLLAQLPQLDVLGTALQPSPPAYSALIGLITSLCSGKEPALLPRTHGWTHGLVALLILTNEKSAFLNRAGGINYLLAVAKKLCDVTSDRGRGASNQIPSTDEIMPDVNHNDLNNTQNSQQALCMRIYIRIVWCQNEITNKVNKDRDKSKHQSWIKKN